MTTPYITKADIQARVSKQALDRCLDDDGDGAADEVNVDAYIRDAQAKIDGRLKASGYSPIPLNANGGPVPSEVKRLCLDHVQAMLGLRHPEYVRVDAKALLSVWKKDLDDLLVSATRLDTDVLPEPKANVGGEILSNDPNNPTSLPEPTFIGTNGFGVF